MLRLIPKPAIINETPQNDPMTEPQQHFYQAIGVVEGVLDINEPNNTLTVGDRSFAVAVANAARKKHQSQQTQCFRVYPSLKKGQIALKVVSVVDSAPTNFTLKGCWELHQDAAFLAVYRNDIHFQGERNLRSLISVNWENAPEPNGKFWELDAVLEGDKLIVIKAEGPFDPPPKATRSKDSLKVPKPELKKQTVAPKPTTQFASQSAPTASVPPSVKPLTPQEIRDMATPVKAQVMCKLNQVPKHRELPDKRIEFFLADGDRVFTVKMKPKMFKKLTEHGYAEWVASITGDLGPATETGFELENASLQVFEKKAKAETEAKPEAKTQSAVARPPAPKVEAKTEGKKSLLDGVKMR